mmetsp:Transcript_26528/g.52096  ORF Transcript_26528/g.52096 Transcript_26528/m.52096 type:complete len:210 (-) Transcript_26528:58-687(-)
MKPFLFLTSPQNTVCRVIHPLTSLCTRSCTAWTHPKLKVEEPPFFHVRSLSVSPPLPEVLFLVTRSTAALPSLCISSRLSLPSLPSSSQQRRKTRKERPLMRGEQKKKKSEPKDQKKANRGPQCERKHKRKGGQETKDPHIIKKACMHECRQESKQQEKKRGGREEGKTPPDVYQRRLPFLPSFLQLSLPDVKEEKEGPSSRRCCTQRG